MGASKNCRPTDLIAHLARFFAEHPPLQGALCVGLSGGRDSVVLLHALSRLALPNPLMALHVHHGLSPHADAWAAHCRALCQVLKVDFSIAYVQVETDAGLGLEGAARTARYRAFADCPARTLVLAHHEADQAETVLFNLLRGCGVTGAAGMLPARSFGPQRLLRPLLGITPAQLDVYARDQSLSWVEDASNADTALSRNFLRHTILPQFALRFPGTQHALAQAAGHFAEADALLSELAVGDWQRCARDDGLALSLARPLSPARLKNLLRWRLRQLGWRVPVTTRLNEFVRQVQTAKPDRHPALALPEGVMQVSGGILFWRPRVGKVG